MQYSFKKPIFSTNDIIGYELIDINGSIKRVKLPDVHKLIEKGLLDGKIAIDEKGERHIVFSGETPKYSVDSQLKLTIEARIVQNNSLSGYRCIDNMGRKLKIKPDKLWECAVYGNVTNAEAKIINNKKVIIGKEKGLKELPILEA